MIIILWYHKQLSLYKGPYKTPNHFDKNFQIVLMTWWDCSFCEAFEPILDVFIIFMSEYLGEI